MLKALAGALNGMREELYEISARTGATRIDSMVDIDGGIGVLFTFGSKGRRELPNSQVYLDGPVEMLSKDGSFIGQHIYTRIPGVAVQINAFNFPVWGMLEKFASAFLAGVPTIAKPATPTGYLAEAVVRRMVDSALLPDGSLQLVSGSARDLLEHLDYRDLVAFTGSASTANKLREHPGVVSGGVRFLSETDSLNAAILGPDADGRHPGIRGVREVARHRDDGQGRAEVHEHPARHRPGRTRRRRDRRATAQRIASRIVIGDPRAEGVTMGALVSREQKTRCSAGCASSSPPAAKS